MPLAAYNGVCLSFTEDKKAVTLKYVIADRDDRVLLHYDRAKSEEEQSINKMKKWVRAKLKWLSAEEGGRKLPMAINTKYCPRIVFPDSPTRNGEEWSAEIYILSQVDKLISIANLSYLVDSAPFELLQEGREFNLVEGGRLVATGTICAQSKMRFGPPVRLK